MATAIFFASSTGNTSEIANSISSKLGDIEVFDIADVSVNKINEYEKLILGVPTWGVGDLQDDWEDMLVKFNEIDFASKTVGLFGLGDQEGYDDTFLDGMGIIYEEIISRDAKVIGFSSPDSYEFTESRALVDNQFVGLGIDEDNQWDLTKERIANWCDQIKNDIL